ncbi:hypothetical protein EIP86_007484 [Pleurotus ostreatoroseus]|nr:hypothetical protein EIP86_007484 [Pleurotus ostreatoroseus]
MKHLVTHIRQKGTVDNYATDMGEALHPQTKLDYRRTNHQDTAGEQMLRMSRERDTVASIRSKIDAAEDNSAFNNTSKNAPAIPVHVTLGSPQHALHVGSYAQHLSKDLGIKIPDFSQRLLDFLRRSLGASAPSNVTFHKVTPFRMVRVSYICQVSARYKQDILHVCPNWRNKGPRYDHAMLQGTRNKPMFTELVGVFTIKIADTTHQIGITRLYRQLARHRFTQHIELEKLQEYDFVFMDSVIRAAHIIPPTVYYARSVVQDLVDGDMYLRLLKTK